MAKVLQFRRFTTAGLGAVTGAAGELIVDTTLNQLTVHDGVTAGGWYAANNIILQNSLGVNLSQNSNITLAYASSNSAASFANGAFVTANSAASFANGSFVTANSAASFANGAFGQANSAASFANGSFGQANSAASFANGSFGQANSAASFANGSFGQANSAASFANGSFGQANSAASFANGAFTLANTKVISSGYTANSFVFANSTGNIVTTSSLIYYTSNNSLYVTGNIIQNSINTNRTILRNLIKGSYANLDNISATVNTAGFPAIGTITGTIPVYWSWKLIKSAAAISGSANTGVTLTTANVSIGVPSGITTGGDTVEVFLTDQSGNNFYRLIYTQMVTAGNASILIERLG